MGCFRTSSLAHTIDSADFGMKRFKNKYKEFDWNAREGLESVSEEGYSALLYLWLISNITTQFMINKKNNNIIWED